MTSKQVVQPTSPSSTAIAPQGSSDRDSPAVERALNRQDISPVLLELVVSGR